MFESMTVRWWDSIDDGTDKAGFIEFAGLLLDCVYNSVVSILYSSRVAILFVIGVVVFCFFGVDIMYLDGLVLV